MARWFNVAVVGAVLSSFAFLLLTGHYINDGPVLMPLGHRHGMHEGDLFVVAGWAASMAALRRLAGPSRYRGAP